MRSPAVNGGGSSPPPFGHSYIAGATLNRDWPRLSDDLQIFLDERDSLLQAVEPELEALRNASYSAELTNDRNLDVEAVTRRGARKRGFSGSTTRRHPTFLPGLGRPSMWNSAAGC